MGWALALPAWERRWRALFANQVGGVGLQPSGLPGLRTHTWIVCWLDPSPPFTQDEFEIAPERLAEEQARRREQ